MFAVPRYKPVLGSSISWVGAVLGCVLALSCGGVAHANFTTLEYVSTAPASIPRDNPATEIILVTWYGTQNAPARDFSGVILDLQSDNEASIDGTAITARVYYKVSTSIMNDKTDTSGWQLMGGSPVTFPANIGTTLTISPPSSIPVASGSYLRIWVSIRIGGTLAAEASSRTLGCEITQVSQVGAATNPGAHGQLRPIDSYAVTLVGTGQLAPGTTVGEGALKSISSLAFTASDSSMATNALTVSSITLKLVGPSGADADLTGITVFGDANANGTYDAGTDTSYGSAPSVTAGSATVTTTGLTITGSKTVYVCATAAPGSAGHEVGLELNNPSTDVVFADVFTLDVFTVTQVGVIASTAPEAATNNTFLVIQSGDLVAPAVSARSPASGASGVLVDAAITATFNDSMMVSTVIAAGAITVVNVTDGGAEIGGTVTYDSQTATYTPPGGKLLPAKQYTVTVRYDVKDDANNQMGADASANVSWSFTTEALPAVLYTTPVDLGANVLTSSTLSVTFTKDMSTLVGDTPTFTITQGTGGNIPAPASVIWDATSKIVTFTGATNFTAEKTYNVQVSGAKDPRGNAAATYDWDFTTENRPAITTTTPASGASNVAVAQNVSATFDRQMSNTAPVPTFTFTGGAVPTGGVTWNPGRTVATFTLTSNLEVGVTYTVTVTGATDMRGNVAPSTGWSFDVELPPVVNSTTPAYESSNIASNATLQIAFSKVMDTGTNPTLGFTPAFTPTTPNWSWTDTRTAVYSFANRLALSQLYEVAVSSAKDLHGNFMTPYTMRFGTEDQPVATTSTPADGSSNVAVDYGTKTITVTYSKDMKQSLIPSFGFNVSAPAGGAPSWQSAKVVQYTFTGTLTPDENYAITVSGAEDVRGNAAPSFVLDFSTESRPVVSSTDPYDGKGNVFVTPVAVSATFTKSMAPASLTTSTFTLYNVTLGSAVATDPGDLIYVDGTRTATLAVPGGLDADTTYRATLTSGVTDVRGNALLASYQWLFQTEVQPDVNIISPADGLGNVLVTTSQVYATFSKAMDSVSIASPATNFTLYAGAANVGGTVTYDGVNKKAIYAVPGGRLEPGVTYTATLEANGALGIKDANGIPLSADRVWAFTTESRPTVTARSPYDQASNMAVTSNVTARFSKEMRNPTDLSTSTFTVKPVSGSAIAGVVTYDSNPASPTYKTATLNPDDPLEYDTDYEVRILASVRDVRDNAIGPSSPADDEVWTFRTEPRPAVASTTPFGNASDVQYTSTVKIVFTEPMNEASVQAAFTLTNTDTSTAVTGTWLPVSGNAHTFVPDKSPTPTASDPWYYYSNYSASLASTAADTSGNTILASGAHTWAFRTVMNQKPAVLSTYPANNSVDVPVTSPAITATFSEPVNQASVEALGVFTLSPAVSGTVTYASGVATFTVTPGQRLAFQTTYTATITAAVKDLDDQFMDSPKVWGFTTPNIVRPTVLSMAPASGEVNVPVATSRIDATFSEPLDPSTISDAVFTLSDGSSPVDGHVALDGTGSILSFTPTAGRLAWATSYTATISTVPTDPDGFGLAAAKTWTFTTPSIVRPAVRSTSPASGATEVPVATSSVIATFSEGLDLATVSNSVFTVKDAANNTVAGTVSYAGSVLTFTPTAGKLAWQTTYTATITTAVKDADGFGMGSDYTWSFATPAIVRPLVLSTTPASAATAVSVRTREIQATTSEELDAATVNGAVFGVVDSSGTPVSGTVSYASSVLTFTLGAGVSFAYGTTYSATIGTGAQDLDGFGMEAAYTWTFTTQPLVRPMVVSSSPAASASDVPITATTLSVTFSKELDPALAASIPWSVTGSRGASVTGSATYTASVLTIVLDRNLAYSTTYTVSIPAQNVKDLEGIGMAADYQWSFITILLNESLAVNNRIDSTAPPDQRQVRIFIPQPPAGAQDRVTVAVFTARGKRVATLVAGRPYEEIVADLPILWDGTNAQSQRLAPGLYFIQITATSFKKVLKVMVSR